MGTIAVVGLLLLAAFAAWHFGYIERFLYLHELESATEATSEEHLLEATQPPLAAAEGQDENPEAEGAAARVFPGYYVYSELGADDREKYRIVLGALQSRDELPYPSDGIDDVERIFSCVMADHPELFAASGMGLSTVTNTGSGLLERASVSGKFTYSPEEADRLAQLVETAADECLAAAPAETRRDDYALAKYLYEWLARQVAYDAEALALSGDERDYAQTVVGPFAYGRAICGGYASAYQLLMQKAGLQCARITGTARGESHAWCLALLDGNYYYIDPTWADPQYADDGPLTSAGAEFVNYDYLCIDDDLAARTHAPDVDFTLPACTALADNYYVREGLLFDEPDEARFADAAVLALSVGNALQVRCTEEGTFWSLRDSLVASGALGSRLPEGRYLYSTSEENLSISVYPA